MASKWRIESRRVIEKALASVPLNANVETKAKAIRGLYPFGQRANHPYKCWLKEVNLALAPFIQKEQTELAKIQYVVFPKGPGYFKHHRNSLNGIANNSVPFWIVVQCGWHEPGHPEHACLACGSYHDALKELLDSAEFMNFLNTARGRNDVRGIGVLADWLESRSEYAEWPQRERMGELSEAMRILCFQTA